MIPTPATAAQSREDRRNPEVFTSQTRLLYRNAKTGVAFTLAATYILALLQWDLISHQVIIGWWLYMLCVSAGRYQLAGAYRAKEPSGHESKNWCVAFAAGAGFAGAGWGAAGILLYPAESLPNQIYLIFVL